MKQEDISPPAFTIAIYVKVDVASNVSTLPIGEDSDIHIELTLLGQREKTARFEPTRVVYFDEEFFFQAQFENDWDEDAVTEFFESEVMAVELLQTLQLPGDKRPRKVCLGHWEKSVWSAIFKRQSAGLRTSGSWDRDMNITLSQPDSRLGERIRPSSLNMSIVTHVIRPETAKSKHEMATSPITRQPIRVARSRSRTPPSSPPSSPTRGRRSGGRGGGGVRGRSLSPPMGVSVKAAMPDQSSRGRTKGVGCQKKPRPTKVRVAWDVGDADGDGSGSERAKGGETWVETYLKTHGVHKKGHSHHHHGYYEEEEKGGARKDGELATAHGVTAIHCAACSYKNPPPAPQTKKKKYSKKRLEVLSAPKKCYGPDDGKRKKSATSGQQRVASSRTGKPKRSRAPPPKPLAAVSSSESSSDTWTDEEERERRIVATERIRRQRETEEEHRRAMEILLQERERRHVPHERLPSKLAPDAPYEPPSPTSLHAHRLSPPRRFTVNDRGKVTKDSDNVRVRTNRMSVVEKDPHSQHHFVRGSTPPSRRMSPPRHSPERVASNPLSSSPTHMPRRLREMGIDEIESLLEMVRRERKALAYEKKAYAPSFPAPVPEDLQTVPPSLRE